jgi:hypothetical protein
MLDDPSEPAFVRDLLRAGVDEEVKDYDFDQGLARHLAIVAAGTPPPPWAEQLSTGAGPGGSAAAGSGAAGGTGAAGAGAVGAAGISLKTAALLLGLPLASAGIVAAVVLGTAEPRPPVAREPGIAASRPARPGGPVSQPVSPLDAVEGDGTEGPQASFDRLEPGSGPGEERLQAASARHRSARTGRAHHRRHGQAYREPEKSPGSLVGEGSYEMSDPATYEGTAAASEKASGKSGQSADVRGDLHARWARGEEPLEQKRARGSAAGEPSPRVLERQAEAEPQTATRTRLDPLNQEMRMLARANNLLSSDPERALAIARSGERHYPDSMFTEERRHIIILALIKLDRMDEARALAWPYLRTYPRGPFSDRIRRALATGQVR